MIDRLRTPVKKTQRILFWAAVLSLTFLATVVHADTLRVCNYNATNFRGSQDSDRYDEFRMILRGIHPDVVVMQEILSEDAVDVLLSFVFLQINSDWTAVPFHNGYDTDNACFYRTSKASLVSARYIGTTLRDIAEYCLRPVAPDTSQRLYFYSLHLKASQGYEQRRLAEAQVLRGQLDLLPAGSLFFVCGDYNLYTSAEPAYEYLLSAGTNANGQLFDPINTPGEWHINAAFAAVHTQSPQADYGGMDDRFDFILVSAGMMDTAGTYCLPSTYTPYGNDGRHFDMGIDEGTNYAVPDSIADALPVASDHLPVYLDVLLRSQVSSVGEAPHAVESFRLLNCYPNPFNPTLTVQLSGPVERTSIAVYDVTGRRVMERAVDAQSFRRPLTLDFSDHSTGTYFVRAQSARRSEVQRVQLVR
jgi:endonuclease/exonuclease/phosphatase family metal-dependent hydrolase